MKALRVLPLVLLMAACSSVKVPLSPYRIDVQQGNALEQESVEKLKTGLTRSQVRFLLGTPLLVDPFRSNRWDYVYNYRKAGKLTEERRLALFFDGDVLVRIEAEGMPAKGEMPAAKPAEPVAPVEKPVEKTPEPAKEAVPTPAPAPVTSPESARPAAVVASEAAKPAAEAAPKPAAEIVPITAVAVPNPAASTEAKPAAEAAVVEAPKPVAPATPQAIAAPVQAAEPAQRSLDETSIVPPLKSGETKPAAAPSKPAAQVEKPEETVNLQTEANVEAIKPDVMPEFPNPAAVATPEDQVMAAINAWAKAWRARDEEAYLAAYAASFRPEGGVSRAEWEKRRRLLLGLARNIDLKIDGEALEMLGEDRAQVSFRQFYRSDSYQDAVIKQLKLVRVDNLWLIEEEKALAPLKVKP